MISLPFNMSVWQLMGALGVAFIAGLIDAIAGGGGLIQLPGIMSVLPGVPVVTLLAINKTSSVFGTVAAFREYLIKVRFDWKRILWATILSFFTAMLGAFTATKVPNGFLRPLVIVLLVILILFTLFKKDFGQEAKESRFDLRAQLLLSLLMGFVMGFYDGFFGPGTGNFLIMMMIGIYGMDFLHASASSKMINGTTNLAALLMYMIAGVGNLPLGVAMGLFNMLGARVGVRLAVLKGSKFIRVLFIVMSVGLLVKQIFFP